MEFAAWREAKDGPRRYFRRAAQFGRYRDIPRNLASRTAYRFMGSRPSQRAVASNTQAPNPRCNSLGQPLKHRANIPFRYAPILASRPFSLLVANTFAEP